MNVTPQVALVADDDEFFRIALGAILTKQFGFSRIVEAASLDAALDDLGSDAEIGVALLDLGMPGMQVAANLKAVRECFPRIRVAVVSASQQRSDILQALEAGVHGYLPKSLGVSGLTDALRTFLAGGIYVPPAIAVVPSRMSEVEQGRKVSDVGLDGTTVADLTARQRQVLSLVVQGKSNKEIARVLRLGEGTVKVHMAALFRSLGVHTRAAAAVAGARLL